MIKQIRVSTSPKRTLNKLINVLNKLNDKPVNAGVMIAKRAKFNLAVDSETGELVGYRCENCGKAYRTSGWVMRHKRC